MSDTTHRTIIPKVDWNGRAADMRSRLVTWDWHWKLPRGKTELVLDFSRVAFMEPWALCMFAAYCLKMRSQGIPVRVQLDPANPSNVYFGDMGLADIGSTGLSVSATSQWSQSHQNTGLHVIRSFKDIDAFRKSAGLLTLEHCQEAADALKYAMTELARNVLQHSGSPIGGVAIAQHFPDDRRIQVAMCDLGQGVRASMQRRYPELRTDMEGLRLAILPHASGAAPAGPYGDGNENAGLGLFYSREIAWRSGGSFWIASGTALLGIRGDIPTRTSREPVEPDRVYRTIESWPGTVVTMDFPVDGVPDFASILRICGSLADEARRISGPAGLDFLGASADVEKMFTVRVADFDENNEVAVRIRDEELRPRIERGECVAIDFDGVRSPTQSFVHALLSEAFKIPGSLVRLSFLHCTPSTREVIKAVAAYASYRQIV